MERDQRFSFKLLVPPRVNNGPISAVQPQEIVEDRGNFMKALQPSYSECFDKEKNILSPNTNVVAPTKPPKQDFLKMKLMQPMEKDGNNCNPGQLYSKLFDEVEKIKCWKVKVYSDTVEKERRLQDNKRTIETQRKAIQELQFGNESLSIKMEEQISENEELRNKNNSTWNLCNILKETFDSSVEKIHLFEAEREETHHLLTENNESVKKMIAAFESLRVRVETDQQEMQKVKEDLLQFDHLQKKYQQEFKIKQEEITMLQLKLKDKETQLQKLLLDLDETQKHCNELQQSTNHQFEVLKSAKAEQESLLQQLNIAEQRCRETEKNQETTAAALEQSKKEYAEVIQSKDLSLQELNRVKNQQAEELECIQSTIQELKTSLALEKERAKELEDKLIENNTELERRNTVLGETFDQATKKDGLIQILKDELDTKSKSIESVKAKIQFTQAKMEELMAELLKKTEEIHLVKKEAENAFAENDSLKKSCEAAEKEKEHLQEKSTLTQIKVQVLEEQLCTEMKKNKECNVQMEQLRKDILQNEVKYEELLSNFNELQSEKTAIQEQFENGLSNVQTIEANMKVSEEKALKLDGEIQTLVEENKTLRDELTAVKTKILGKCVQTETLQKQIEEKYEQLQVKITEKEKQIKAVETKLCKLRKQYEIKFKAQEEYKKENKMLKKQMAQEIAKSSDLETTINSLQNESQNLKQLKGEEHEKLLKALESKSTFAAELEKEVQKLRITAAEAIKNKEATELKCQHKIGDMVTLMEKHKSQYDRMVQEKDAELEEKKKNEMEATAREKSLELDLSKHKSENERLKKELKAETREKKNLRNKTSDLKQEMSVVKSTLLSQGSDKQVQVAASNYKQGKSSEVPKENSSKSHTFDVFKAKKTSSYSKDGQSLATRTTYESATEFIRASCGTPKSKCINSEDMKTPRSLTNHIAGTTKIKSYRIRTPPSEQSAQWGKSAIELDPKSDSSDQNDLLTFTNTPAHKSSDSQCKLHILKKNQSPLIHKSPGNSLKLAAMKRMRDAGWTAVTGCDKKKKKTNEKIFA
ncbi:synaptonemal complex protein 1 [Haplochromis burtoni]|uniref:Synaptonemal complex protein 1 n=1 Tax=Haplochromis burtoni TaxID=8153 RepID=A0A3Q2VCR3_HAPBU|nr:synaptonemal complex protein 1 [Haplochromis burtoni]XP_005943020.1 synaptonemal complex protein 1 [Haplochromis burtoni]